jgi:hypothetical protein
MRYHSEYKKGLEMRGTQLVIELLPEDNSAQRLLFSLEYQFRTLLSGLPFRLERKEQFEIAPAFQKCAILAMQQATAVETDWCLYLSPRRLVMSMGGTQRFVNSVTIAVSRKRKPAALFLHTVLKEELPTPLMEALSIQVEKSRTALVTTRLNDDEEVVVESYRTAIENAYVDALWGTMD